MAAAVRDPVKHLTRQLEEVRSETGERTVRIFTEWIECCAYAIANRADTGNRQEREDAYMRIAKNRGREIMVAYSHMLGDLSLAVEAGGEPRDVLSSLYHAVSANNSDMGQFFTPGGATRLLAEMVIDRDALFEAVVERGYASMQEPACGAGGMIIAAAALLRQGGFDPTKHLRVHAIDLDITAVHMTYVQLSLLGIPAIVVHGDALTLSVRSEWYTAAALNLARSSCANSSP